MRLLVVATWFPCPPDNGSRLRTYHLLRHLARRHEITLLAFGDPAPDDVRAAREFCRHVTAVPPGRRPDAPLGLRGLLSPTPRHFVQDDSPQMRLLVRDHAGRHDAALGIGLGAARYLVPGPHLPRVFDEAEVALLREQFTRAPTLHSRARFALTWWKYRHFVRRVVQGCERATVVSSVEHDHLRDIGCDAWRLAIVPNGVDVAAKRPSGAPRLPRLVYPGAVTYSANLDAVRFFTLEILPRIRSVRPEMEFLVSGATGHVDVSTLAASGATFTGWLPDVDALVAGSAACVVPLRIGGGTRLKVLEAMALGTPVVSTAKGVEGLEVEPGRHVLVADTPTDFATQVLRLLDDGALAERLAEDGRRFVEQRHDWARIGTAMEQVVDEAVGAFRGRRG